MRVKTNRLDYRSEPSAKPPEPTPQDRQKALDADIAAFLKSGGKVQQLAPPGQRNASNRSKES